MKLVDKYSVDRLETACRETLSFAATSSYKSIKNILDPENDQMETPDKRMAIGSYTESGKNSHVLTRGADYYRSFLYNSKYREFRERWLRKKDTSE